MFSIICFYVFVYMSYQLYLIYQIEILRIESSPRITHNS